MGTIVTFDPPVARNAIVHFVTVFGECYVCRSTDDHILAVNATNCPCDLTLDGSKPSTWARAVYEAGKRDGVVEHILVFGGPRPAHPSVEAEYGKGYIEGVMGGVTQQPRSNAECLRRATAHADGIVDRAIARAAQQPTSKPEQPAKVPVCKLCERHLWDGPRSMVDGWAFCGHGCADTYYQSLQPQWKPPEKISLNGVEYVPKVTPPSGKPDVADKVADTEERLMSLEDRMGSVEARLAPPASKPAEKRRTFRF